MSAKKTTASTERHLMPHTLGKWPNIDIVRFPENFIIKLSYLSDAAALKSVLPQALEINGDPIITFMYRHAENLDWASGSAEHNVCGAFISATYSGAQDRASGAYWPFIWENDAMAIVLGREVFGVAKLPADISNPRNKEGVWHVQMSSYGHPLVELRFRDEREAKQEELKAIQEQARQARVLGWKHIPSPDMQSADLSYPTLFESPNQIRAASFGTGEVVIHRIDQVLDPWSYPVVESLRSIPLTKCVSATLTRGAGEHRISSGRRLR